ncbi:MAG: hypothetical protein LBP59_04160 [Planctomycetaceae bacterium]|jgi:hypothetical protein|nr:hypothetical protein [Planctomycetaceae bacterium]
MSTIISTISTGSFDILFGINFSTIVSIIVITIYIIVHIASSLSDARETVAKKSQNSQKQKNSNINQNVNIEQSEQQEIIFVSKAREKKKRNLRKPQPDIPTEFINDNANDQKITRKALARELPQQGQGTRFDAAPGTLNAIQLAPTVEVTVKPELESLTGIYEQNAQNVNIDQKNINNLNPQNIINLNELLLTPDGIRNAVILSEILNRPNF